MEGGDHNQGWNREPVRKTKGQNKLRQQKRAFVAMSEERTKRKAGLGSVLGKGSKKEKSGEKAEPLDPPSLCLPSSPPKQRIFKMGPACVAHISRGSGR